MFRTKKIIKMNYSERKMNMKSLIVGGNSGIGLALSVELLRRGVDKIYIVGKDEPDFSALDNKIKRDFENKVIFKKQNFVSFDESVFNEIDDIDSLIITTGFGRVALFQELMDEEIKNLLRVDLESIVRIIRHYYNKIASNKDFYTAVVVSVCGRIVSPFYSVYGSAKGGLRFLIENLNCELMAKGFSNRILDISPGFLNGTAFNGGRNKLSSLKEISQEIICRMFNKETLYIPQYDEIYKDVLQRYNNNMELFGQESYQYKLKSGRKSSRPQVVVGYLSGTFDLFHIGHLNLLKRAKEQCDYLIVSVHVSGAWKGKETFIPYEERRAIVESIKYVDLVVDDYIEDYDAWGKFHYDKLFVGSDYKGTERFNRYEKLLKGKAEIIYFPYTKGTSSTQLREVLSKNK